MCGRYAQSKSIDDLIERFGITGATPQSPLAANWNIAPTQEIYFIRQSADQKGRELATASWGLIAPWQKEVRAAKASQSHAINARSESVFEKPTFRDAFRKKRAIIPADGYYEWATALGEYRPKQPFYISREDGKSLAMAGIWSSWQAPSGQIVESAAIITRAASGFLNSIHSRMPVFLPADDWERWLDPALRNIEELCQMMEFSQPEAGLHGYAIADSVNSTTNNARAITDPIRLGAPETLF